jgi:hypothetical protein
MTTRVVALITCIIGSRSWWNVLPKVKQIVYVYKRGVGWEPTVEREPQPKALPLDRVNIDWAAASYREWLRELDNL